MIVELTQKLKSKLDLSASEMTDAMRTIMSGNAAVDDISGFLLALAEKGETVDEIVAAASVMRQLAVPVRVKGDVVLDTCGTGGDRKGTFNISTTAALVVSACGVTVAKHGNRSVSSSCGSADVLEAAGVVLSMPVDKIERCLQEVGIAFLYAPDFHPAMKHAAAARKQLGRRTIFNIMGPLCNPAKATHQLVGVFSPDLMPVIAGVLGALGTERALVIHSKDGLDEISTTGTTLMCEYRNGKTVNFEVTPEMFGLSRVSVGQLQGGSVQDNVQTMLDILRGVPGIKRDIVILNAAGALYAADQVATIADGVARAVRAIDSGARSKN
ncbi:MAG: anthranilate phosphoribosyltransferase [Candidatus Omnitrophota bacterium]